MLYRRKVLLGLLEALDRSVSKVDLQKYLFLVCAQQDTPAYEFIPYRLGCFSFQIEADKRTLTRYGLLKTEEQWTRTERVIRSNGRRHVPSSLSNTDGYLDQLRSSDQQIIERVVRNFGRLRSKELIRYVYRRYPYYAINSEIRDTVLNASDQKRVQAARPIPTPARLFTIGYEGKSLEGYLKQLLDQWVGVLCDVRRNAVSRKYGFSKRQLQSAVEHLGMSYVHMPELGIASRQRQGLQSAEEFRALFQVYTQTTLVHSTRELSRILVLIRQHGRLALTCFEADHGCCHRGRIVAALQQHEDFHHRVVHL